MLSYMDAFEAVAGILQRSGELEGALALISNRDDIVRAAYAAGFSKTKIHRLTGLARSTIDRILTS
jgi:hypothetical protein